MVAKLPGVRGILANAGWLYLDQIVRAVVTLVTFGLMTRALGPAGIGHLSYALAFPAIFIPLAALGLDYVIIRELVRRPAEQAAIFATGFWLKFGGSGLAFAICAAAGLALVDPGEPARPLLFITTLTLLLHPSTIIDCFFQSRVASRYSAIARMSSSLVASAFRIWLVVSGRPLIYFAWAYLLELALLAVAMLVAFRVDGSVARFRLKDFQAPIARALLAAAWPLFLADVAIALYSRFNFVLLDHLAGAETLGRYAAAMRLSDAIEFFPLAVIGSYFPHIVSLHRDSPVDFPERLRRFLSIMTWSTVAVALLVSLLAPWLVRVILGAGFATSAGALVYLVWGNVFATQVAVRGRWYLAEELQIYTFWFFALGAAVQLGLFYILVPRMDADGAAAAYLWAQIAMAVALPLLFPRTRAAGKMAIAGFLPNSALAWVRRRRGVRWSGDYSSWGEARAESSGYDSPEIFQRVVDSSRLVRDGRAAAERDSIVLAEAPLNLPLDSALNAAAELGKGTLSVVDFGGALGSNYWPRREWLGGYPGSRWAVVEQANFVSIGRSEFQNAQLKFYRSLDECCAAGKPTIVLLSSVLPYLEDPHAVLADIVNLAPPYIFVDRTGFADRPADRLTVQHVPASIYPATYPCWFFSRHRFLDHFSASYTLVAEHDNAEDPGPGLAFKGFLFKIRSPKSEI